MSGTACSAVVLAGGKGERMGCDKALLGFRGRTLIQHAVDTLRHESLRGRFGEILIVGREPEHFDLHGADAVLPDDAPGAGPLGGIATGLRHMKCGRGFFVACAMPLLDARVVAALKRIVEPYQSARFHLWIPPREGFTEEMYRDYVHLKDPSRMMELIVPELRRTVLRPYLKQTPQDAASAGGQQP